MSLQDDRRANFIAWMEASDLNMNQVSEASGVQYNTIRSYVVETKGKRTGSLSGENESKIAAAYRLSVEDIFGVFPGSDDRPNHLRAWRDFRGKTLDELADAIGAKSSTVELYEQMPTPPSDKWLRRVAPALGTTAGMISDYDPNDLDRSALEGALRILTSPFQPVAAPEKAKANVRVG